MSPREGARLSSLPLPRPFWGSSWSGRGRGRAGSPGAHSQPRLACHAGPQRRGQRGRGWGSYSPAVSAHAEKSGEILSHSVEGEQLLGRANLLQIRVFTVPTRRFSPGADRRPWGLLGCVPEGRPGSFERDLGIAFRIPQPLDPRGPATRRLGRVLRRSHGWASSGVRPGSSEPPDRGSVSRGASPSVAPGQRQWAGRGAGCSALVHSRIFQSSGP